jgi:DNA adenine methylase
MSASSVTRSSPQIRPFLKWAGGKRQLLPELRRFVPSIFHAYHEPFLGSGAVFFDLIHCGQLDGRPCRLTDTNRDLIGCYTAVARDVEGVIRELRSLAAAHRRSGAAAYYRVRDQIFNPRRRQLAGSGVQQSYPADLAAMFIYLNRTGYNGLFRLNARGDFNVPAGRYADPQICEEDRLRAASRALSRPLIHVALDSFDGVAGVASSGDLVYFDPPYAPLSSTSRFTAYTAASFTDADQKTLQRLVVDLADRGCQVVVSNSSAPLVADLYGSRAAREAGLRIHRVAARRAINSNARRRGRIEELIISNVNPVAGPA